MEWGAERHQLIVGSVFGVRHVACDLIWSDLADDLRRTLFWRSLRDKPLAGFVSLHCETARMSRNRKLTIGARDGAR